MPTTRSQFNDWLFLNREAMQEVGSWHEIMCKLKSEAGSSLVFVLIIAMVILILVAALLVVANGEFTFTQENPGKPAYIDAKSVIEFGKIEINARKKYLDIGNNDLKNLNNEYKTAKEANQDTTTIEKTIAAKKVKLMHI